MNYEPMKDIIARRNQDGTVVLMKLDEASLFYKIDGIAAAVWAEIQHGRSLEQLLLIFKEKYPAFQENLEKDIPSFIGDLLKRNLIVAA